MSGRPIPRVVLAQAVCVGYVIYIARMPDKSYKKLDGRATTDGIESPSQGQGEDKLLV